ncbi:tricarballylate utilization 4Fe-4S protein TcuB [Thalassospira marina]|uniref:Tricarballylate utilization protein TcuB n=1 Tax=Thalassospira marina TaxID=2048283 RepID=A0ABN5FLB6_9PROT|nr:tricarballylate utilization 4Fe-4S protein TcuB [Thalassospira marina]AUG55516.1 tricarballylate utilization protein TcuB [Thalassospira marina]
MRSTDKTTEAARVMSICNACRYCEGHCAVFQAMELRLEFNADTVDYLANLCHNCGACYHNCQYAPPHEFALNVPAAMAELRQENYGVYAWPGFMGKLFVNNGLWVSLLSIIVITLFAITTAQLTGNDFFSAHANAFYGVIPHNVLAGLFGAVGLFVLLALTLSCIKFWRAMQLPNPLRLNYRQVGQGIKNALTLKYLDGGNGQGCSYPDETPSMARRWFHQFTFWGFMLCFAATSTGTILHYGFDLPAPYGFVSLPKLFGILGGLGLIIGPLGLLALKIKADPTPKGKTNKGMDVSFLVLLMLSAATGLGLMLLRDTSLVGITLCIHLGVVLTLFLSMPYGKFVHGFYRLIALVVFAVETQDHKAIVGTPKTDTQTKIKAA